MNEQKKNSNIILQFFKQIFHPTNRHYFRITYQVVWNLFLIVIIVGIIGLAFAGGVGAGYFASLVKDEPIRSKEELAKGIYNYEETSEIYFANDILLGKLRTDLEREEVPLSRISTSLKNAVIATEDEYFYEHEGVLPKAIFRALFQEFSNSSNQTGGSTLTQQLIKQQILSNQVSFDRKAKEILLALRVESFFEKDAILEAYLNVSPFGRNSSGRNIAGVQAAAEGIFGIPASELNLAQSAYIAGLPQSPFGYTPFTNEGTVKSNLEPGLNRQKTVLSRMYHVGFISEKEYETALTYDVTKDFIQAQPPAFEQYPWLTTEIEKRAKKIISIYLAKQDGYTEADFNNNEQARKQYIEMADKAIRQNGYNIHTTINKEMYDKMQKAAASFNHYGKNKTEEKEDLVTGKMMTVEEPVELGAVLIENKTGKILSFVGGRNFKREETNHATSALRSNGSTMKPLLVYAPGIELGTLAPGTLVIDGPYAIPDGGNIWQPKNSSGTFTGLSSARKALKDSQNTSAVKFYLDIIHNKPVQYLEKMGFSTLTEVDYSNPSMALGALNKGVTVEENTNAYATLANDGQFIDAYMIEKISTKKGEIIYEHKSNPINVFSPQTAYLTIDMMRDVLINGTARTAKSRLKFSSDFAGKTGTSQDTKDSWFVASNPNVTLGVWTGYDTPKTLNYSYNGLSYSQRTQYLWADLMNTVYTVDQTLIAAKTNFNRPSGIVSRSTESLYGISPTLLSQANVRGFDLFPANYAQKVAKATTSSASFISLGNKKYLALDSTPREFVEHGTILSKEFLQKLGGKYLSHSYVSSALGGMTTGASQLHDNGRAPLAMTLSLHNKTITWNRHTDGDVIGYRVYKNNQKTATIKADQKLSYKGSAGEYIVKAVDISGKESPSSNIITIEEPITPPETVPSDATVPIEPSQPITAPKTEQKPIPDPTHESNPSD